MKFGPRDGTAAAGVAEAKLFDQLSDLVRFGDFIPVPRNDRRSEGRGLGSLFFSIASF